MKNKGDFCNQEMMCSYYNYETYIKMLLENGFKVIYTKNQNKYEINEGHNWVILQK